MSIEQEPSSSSHYNPRKRAGVSEREELYWTSEKVRQGKEGVDFSMKIKGTDQN